MMVVMVTVVMVTITRQVASSTLRLGVVVNVRQRVKVLCRDAGVEVRRSRRTKEQLCRFTALSLLVAQ